MRLDLICAKDELRQAMSHIFINKEVMVATNAHVLCVIPTKNLFDPDFISGIPEKGMYVHPFDFKSIVSATTCIWKGEGVVKLCTKNKRDTIIETFTIESIGRYPNWEMVVPEKDTRKAELNKIGINFILASDLQKALGLPHMELQFAAANKAIYCSFENTIYEGIYGIVMPVISS